ncbi:hypothetical protein NDU88_010497 [Pleurodeles waltl]|uniref:Uncharacterized protein n=1 Tax=Pleurodeles waltl TaxID=8319 RepID=A0AAV7QW30_PLEWA|nr:hypothetical protein NDU88_010497 [Pleurodeles waltl]
MRGTRGSSPTAPDAARPGKPLCCKLKGAAPPPWAEPLSPRHAAGPLGFGRRSHHGDRRSGASEWSSRPFTMIFLRSFSRFRRGQGYATPPPGGPLPPRRPPAVRVSVADQFSPGSGAQWFLKSSDTRQDVDHGCYVAPAASHRTAVARSPELGGHLPSWPGHA